MKTTVNKPYKDEFASAFMAVYASPGVNVPWIRKAYGKTFEVVELRANYKVTIRGVIRRFNSLFLVGEFIYEQNYDPRKVYRVPLTVKQLQKRGKQTQCLRTQWYARLIRALKKRAGMYQFRAA